MSWFGFGGSNKSSDTSSSSSSDFNTVDFNHSDSFSSSNDSSYAPSMYSAPSSGSSNNALASLQSGIAAEQERLMIQALIIKLTDMSFEKCIEKPSSSLSGSEQSCIKATVGKYFDASEYVIHKVSAGLK